MIEESGTHHVRGGRRCAPEWSWLTALALLFAAAAGCGSRTGLREERVVGTFPDWRVQTVCQCGSCKTVPWCASAAGTWLCDIGTTCPCNTIGQVPINRELTSTDANGAAIGLYCFGPANTAGDGEQALIPFGGRRWNMTTGEDGNGPYCLLTNDGLLRATGRSVPSEFNRAATCGASPYRCSTVPGSSVFPSNHNFAEELVCPKADALPDPAVFVPGTSQNNAIQNARPLLGAMCELLSHPYTVGLPIPGSEDAPRFHCFARRGTVAEAATPNAGMARVSGGVVITDPGHAFGGDDCVAYQSYNYLRITRLSDGVTGTATLAGSGSAATSADGMALTEFRLQQVGTTSYDGYSLSNVQVHIEDLWSGDPTSTAGVYTVAADGARVQGQYTIGTSTYSLRLTAITNATMSWNGTWYTIDARFSSDDVGIQYDLHIELDLARARPTATVTPVGDVECTSPAGALVTVSGTHTGSSGQTRSAWSVNTDTGVLLASGGASATFQLPLLAPWGSGLEPQLTVFDGMLTARASAPARVIDTGAPTITSSWIHVDCGWGSIEDDPYDPKYCLGVDGTTTDLCSSANVRTLWVTQYLGCNRSSIVRQDAKACVRPDPNHWGSNISDIIYEMDYAPVDAWGNQGTTTRVSFKVNPGPPAGACYYPRTVIMNPCGWGW